jgi:signal transduction histidine kinase
LFCSVVGLLFIASYLVLYLIVAQVIHNDFDHRLLETATTLSDDLAKYIASPGDITEVDTPGQIFEIFDERGRPVALSRGRYGHLLGIDIEKRSSQFFKTETFDLPEHGKFRAVSVPVRSVPVTALDSWGLAVYSSRGGTLEVCGFQIGADANLSSHAAPVPATKDPSRCVTAPADYSWHDTAMPARGTGKFTVSFEATPSLITETRVGLSQGEQTESAAFPISVFFNSSGLIQARNGESKQGAIPYRAGHSYYFRLLVDMTARGYSVFVKPAKGQERELGSNFSFRKPRDWTLVVARSTRETDASLVKLQRIILILLVSNLILVAVSSASYVRRSLRPLSDLTERVASLGQYLKTQHPSEACRYQQRLPPLQIDSNDEPGRLAEAFNQLAAILNDTLQQMRQFVSNASHELRTPLAILCGEAELLLRRPRSSEEYGQTLTVIHTELKHLADIVEGLFTLSMADAGQLRIARESLYLNDLLEEACALVSQRAHAKSIKIEQLGGDEVLAAGDEALLRELFLIFLDNALKYSSPHTSIRVSLKTEDSTAIIAFADHGIGIAPEHLSHIFERFYRVPAADSDDVQGGGLGLAIASAIAHAHGGTIECASTPGQGSVFTIRLPHELITGNDLSAKRGTLAS